MFLEQALGKWKVSGKEDVAISGLKTVSGVMLPLVHRIQENISRLVHQAVNKRAKEDPVGLEDFVGSTIAEVFGLILFGDMAHDKVIAKHLGSYSRKIEGILGYGMVMGVIPFVGPALGRWIVTWLSPTWKARRDIYSAVVSRQAQPKRQSDCVMDILLDEGHSPSAIANALVLMIFATVGSTTRAAQQHLIHLMSLPHFIPLLRSHLDAVLETIPKDDFGNPIITKETPIPAMASALKESLRHFTHRLEGWRKLDYDLPLLHGGHVPKHSIIAIDFPNLHFDQDAYGSDAHQYLPLRFMDATTSTKNFLVFGFGKHACPGRHLSSQLIVLFMSALLARHDPTAPGVSFDTNPYFKDIQIHLSPRQDI
ncbi:hypothetical protein DSO57_1012491 [Entomophthora muscae]|uniref:Uncharacterized protein n=1 Tax=Entomophthora muscae TaxID=34485 RepID=A0ACC2SIV7_9FUNG|nr:hypothetical protein DSO57_1012491 [Entomophthora muscae]